MKNKKDQLIKKITGPADGFLPAEKSFQNTPGNFSGGNKRVRFEKTAKTLGWPDPEIELVWCLLYGEG